MRSATFSALATLALAAAAAPATAGEVTIRIDYSDLDPSSPVDADKLIDRIDLAVARACTRSMRAGGYSQEALVECKDDGKAKALLQLERQIDAGREAVSQS